MASHDVSRHRATLIRLTAYASGTLVGFADVRMPSGVEYYGCPIHIAGSRAWASPPGKPCLGKDGELLREPDGRPRYGKVIGFSSHGVRRRWSDSVLAAVNEAHPDILARAEGEPILPLVDAEDLP
jgi:hypothetical protein